jgi:hypothetical protein
MRTLGPMQQPVQLKGTIKPMRAPRPGRSLPGVVDANPVGQPAPRASVIPVALLPVNKP